MHAKQRMVVFARESRAIVPKKGLYFWESRVDGPAKATLSGRISMPIASPSGLYFLDVHPIKRIERQYFIPS